MAAMDVEGAVAHNGITPYFSHKIEELRIVIRHQEENIRRLEAQRNDWNSKGDRDGPASPPSGACPHSITRVLCSLLSTILHCSQFATVYHHSRRLVLSCTMLRIVLSGLVVLRRGSLFVLTYWQYAT